VAGGARSEFADTPLAKVGVCRVCPLWRAQNGPSFNRLSADAEQKNGQRATRRGAPIPMFGVRTKGSRIVWTNFLLRNKSLDKCGNRLHAYCQGAFRSLHGKSIRKQECCDSITMT